MRAFWSVLCLELRRLARSRTAAILALVCVAWMLVLPHISTSDGTAEGARTLYVHLSLAGSFVICCVALAASCACSLSKEREESRLDLARVRPATRVSLAAGRLCAHAALGAAVLAIVCAMLVLRVGASRSCDHVLDPVLPPPSVEAEKMYERYRSLLPRLDEPDAPEELVEVLTAMTNTPKATVLRMFTQKAMDRYETVVTNATASWRFNLPDGIEGRALSARMRFASDFNLREDVRGVFSFGDFSGSVSDITKTIVKVPLAKKGGESAPAQDAAAPGVLRFTNTGPGSVMLRPRRDVKLLVAADSFAANLARAYLQLLSILAAICAFAVFLGSWLGRTVAVFTCMVMLFVGAVSSDVIVSYPDQLESDRIDRISLAITRAVELASRPLSSLSPIAALSADECVEPRQTALVVAIDGLAIPTILSLLAAFAISRKRSAV